MNKVDLKVISNFCPYSQSGQTADIQFSALKRIGKNSFEELHYHVKCREYFGDTLLASYFDKDLPTIYGFKLIDKRMTTNETLFSVSIPDNSYQEEAHFKSFIKGLKILRKVERDMGIPLKERSKYFITDKYIEDSRKIVVISPKEWSLSPLLISLYTFVLRLTTYPVRQDVNSLKKYMKEVDNKYNGTDIAYIRELYHLDIEHLLKNYVEILGDAPLTGLDDDKVREIAFKPGSHLNTTVGLTYDASKHNGSDKQSAVWSLYNNHNEHGIVTFSKKCKAITNNSFDSPQTYIGYKWAVNYINSLKGDK